MGLIAGVSDFFLRNQDDLFKILGLGADWWEALVSEFGKEIAHHISEFSLLSVDVFSWVRYGIDMQSFSNQAADQAAHKTDVIFFAFIRLCGSASESLKTLQTRLKIVNFGRAFFALSAIPLMADLTSDCREFFMANWTKLDFQGKAFFSIKLISSISMSLLAAVSLVTGVVFSTYLILVLSSLFYSSKIYLHYHGL